MTEHSDFKSFGFFASVGTFAADRSRTGQTLLSTCINLRWIAVIGQALTLGLVSQFLGFENVSPLAYFLVASSAILNLILLLMLSTERHISGWEILLQQGWDIFQLGLLLSVTGGLSNPFLLLLLAPVTTGAILLERQYAYCLATLALIIAGLMPLWSFELPWNTIGLEIPPIWELGHFVALATGVVFFSISTARVRQDEVRLAQALDAARIVVEKEQRMSALGALSAMTAHELGTPLATIHLVARELSASSDANPELMEDANLIVAQAERCRAILKQLSQARDADDVIHAHLPLATLIEEAIAPHRGLGVQIEQKTGNNDNRTDMTIRRAPEIIHAVGAFVENAVSFADSLVSVETAIKDDTIFITISDDGPGFSKDVLPKLGEPYVTERSEKHLGGGDMGLGFFIAKTLIEHHNGLIVTANKPPPKRGAIVSITLPYERFDAKELDYASKLD